MKTNDRITLVLALFLAVFVIISFVTLSYQNSQLKKVLIDYALQDINTKLLTIEETERQYTQAMRTYLSELSTELESMEEKSAETVRLQESIKQTISSIENYSGKNPIQIFLDNTSTK